MAAWHHYKFVELKLQTTMNKTCPRCGKYFKARRYQVYCDNCEAALLKERTKKKVENNN